MTHPPRLLAAPNLECLLDHFGRRWLENQRERLGPVDPSAPFARDTFRDRFSQAWPRSVGEPGWQRTWAAFIPSGDIIGHVDLRARPEPSTPHRTLMSMGIEEPFRRKGLGTALLSTALAWAAQQQEIAWVDLFYFEKNVAAAALYHKIGFTAVSRVEDMFRVAGISVSDIFMTKKLRSE